MLYSADLFFVYGRCANRSPCLSLYQRPVCLGRRLFPCLWLSRVSLLVMGHGVSPINSLAKRLLDRCSRMGWWSRTVFSCICDATSLSLFTSAPLAGLPGPTLDGFDTPIISSASRFCFCSGVSYQAELSSSFAPGARAPLPVLKPRARGLLGSMRAARSSCLGAMVIHSSRCCFGAVVVTPPCSELLCEGFSIRVSSPLPGAGRAGPNSSTSSLSESCAGFDSAEGFSGLSSRFAGGMAGPITLLRFSPSLLLGEGFAPGAMRGPSSTSSSCRRLRLTSKCGGRSGPRADMIIRSS